MRLNVDIAPGLKVERPDGGGLLALSPDGALLALVIRDADGKIVWPIRAPGFRNTGLFGLDDKGRMVGFVASNDAPTQAVFLRPSHRFAFFAYPGATFTEFTDINTHGQICGDYYTPDNKEHGFIALVRADD